LLHTRREIVAGVSASMGLLGRIPLVRAFTPSCTQDDDDASWILLLSDDFVRRGQGIRRYLVHPRKLPEPIILPDENCIHNPYVFGTLIYDATACRFRLWYQTYNRGRTPQTAVLHADSADGLKWRKTAGPVRCPSSGMPAYLLVPDSLGDIYSPSVIHDPQSADKSRRYKMVYTDYIGGRDPYTHGGVFVAFSEEGLNWKPYWDNPVMRFERAQNAVSDVVDVFYDAHKGEYELFAKGWRWEPDKAGRLQPKYRNIVKSTSTDFIKWTRPGLVVDHKFDAEDPQSYGMPVFRAGNMKIGLLRSYKRPGNNTLDIRLLASADGSNWFYPVGMQTYMPNGEAGSFDSGMITTAPPVTVGDRHYIAYGGWDGHHESRARRAAIGMAIADKHRFAALTGGRFDTRPVAAGTKRIEINVEAAEDRPLTYELVNEEGQTLPGFAEDDCIPIRENAFARELRFKGQAFLPKYAFSVRFHVRDAAIFAYRPTA
jgi:hypothetical protein